MKRLVHSLLIALLVSAMLTEPVSAFSGMLMNLIRPNGETGVYLTEYLGITRNDIVSFLQSHEHDDFLLGTPYNFSSEIPAVSMNPRGDVAPGYSMGMNCTGFVAYTFYGAGVPKSTLARIGKEDNYGGSDSYTNASCWHHFVQAKNITSYRFHTISDALKSGKLRKGDVLYFDPYDWNSPGADCHIGIFWGDTPSDDKFWHTVGRGNIISNIFSATPGTVYVFPAGPSEPVRGYIRVEKTSAKPAVTAGNSRYSLKGAQFGIFTDSACTECISTLTTDSSGITGAVSLDDGTYYIKELKSSKNYWPDQTVYKTTVRHDKASVIYSKALPNEPGYLQIARRSSLPSATDNNSDYTLSGARYGIYTDSACSSRILTLTTDEQGMAYCELEEGDYYVREIGAAGRFLQDTGVYPIVSVSAHTAEVVSVVTPDESISYADLSIHQAAAEGTISVMDTIRCTALTVGESYTVEAALLDGIDAERPVQINGQSVTARYTFTASHPILDVRLPISFSAQNMTGRTVTVSVRLLQDQTLKDTLSGKANERQALHFPKAAVSSRDVRTGSLVGVNGDSIKISTTLQYENLIPEQKYTLTGTVYSQSAKKAVSKEFSQSFTPDAASGSVELQMEFAADSAGQKFYVINRLQSGDTVLAAFDGEKDPSRYLSYPAISGTASVGDTNAKELQAGTESVIVSTVRYSGLQTGEAYTITGTLLNRETGEPLTENGHPITASASVTPRTEEGTVSLQFKLDTSKLAGCTVVVAAELKKGELLLASEDATDNVLQSVSIIAITAQAADTRSGSRQLLSGEKTELTDTVSYTGLVAGNQYRLTAVLMNVKTGSPVMTAGKPVTATVEFVPESADGTVELRTSLDTGAVEGERLLFFETLYDKDGTAVAVLTDRDRKNLILTVSPKAGPGLLVLAAGIAAGVLTAAVIVLIAVKKKKRKKAVG